MTTETKQEKSVVEDAGAKAPQPTAQSTAPKEPGTDLSIADLKNLQTIIDIASTRGAFRANEMATIGAMYNKLQTFLSKVAPEQNPAGVSGAALATTVKK